MKVLVTGATGRVGANMIKRLRRENVKVKAMVMPGDPQVAKLDAIPGIEIAEASLSDQAAVGRACRGVTHVVHLAAQLARGDTAADEYFDTNAFGTLRLLEGVVEAGGVERFVLASTDGTYGPGAPPAVPISEDAPQHPATHYGTSKLLGEVIVRNHAAQFDIPFAITRFATVLSPEEAGTFFTLRAIRALVGRAEMGRHGTIWQLFEHHPDAVNVFKRAVGDAADDTAVGLVGPDGSPWTMHLVDVRDAIEGVYLALTHPDAVGEAFNIAAARPTSHDEAAAAVAKSFGVPQLMVQMPMTWRLEMTVDKARRILGYQPRHDYRSMIESSRADGDSYIPAAVIPAAVQPTRKS